MDAVIFDIDGTLANAGHRIHLLEGIDLQAPDERNESWIKFLDLADQDEAFDEMVKLNHMAAAMVPIFIFTGRKESSRRRTMWWLEKYGVIFHKMWMRADHDHRPDDIIKKEMLDRLQASGYKPLFAVEDRDRNVRMFRDNGVRTLQVTYGDY
jgi:phosphoglycolate phosphatase-like HAD superfamily hydrolase